MRAVNLIPAEERRGARRRRPQRRRRLRRARRASALIVVMVAGLHAGGQVASTTSRTELAARQRRRPPRPRPRPTSSQRLHASSPRCATSASRPSSSWPPAASTGPTPCTRSPASCPTNAWLTVLTRDRGAVGERRRRRRHPLRASLPVPAIEIIGCTTSQSGVARVMAAMRLIDGVQRVSLASSRRPTPARGGGAARGSDPRRRRADCRAGSFTRATFQLTVFYDAPRGRRHGDRRSGDRRRPATGAHRRGRHDRPGEHDRPASATGRYQVTARDRIVLMVVGAVVAPRPPSGSSAVAPKREEVEGRRRPRSPTAQQRLEAADASVADRAAGQARLRHRLRRRSPAWARPCRRTTTSPSLVYQLESAVAQLEGRLPLAEAREQRRRAPAAPRHDRGRRRAAAAPARSTSGSTRPPAASTSASTPAAAATPAPATQLAAAALPPGATVGAAGFPTMPFTFIFDGSFFDMEHLLRDVNRFITVDGNVRSSVTRPPADDRRLLASRPRRRASRAVTATLRATAYLLPADQGLTAGATAPAPAAPRDRRSGRLDRLHRRLHAGPAHRRRNRGEVMPFLKNIGHDLIEKRLWPVAVLLVLALVAVPVVLGGGSAQTPAAAPTAAAAGAAAGQPASRPSR